MSIPTDLGTIGQGNTKRITWTLTDPTNGGVPYNPEPSNISMKLRDPTGTETTRTLSGGAIVRDSQSVWHTDIVFTIGGFYYMAFTGTTPAVEGDAFITCIPSAA